MDWSGLKRIETVEAGIVASSWLATCNTYVAARTLQTAKKVNPDILTVTGGQHFTATAQESLEEYPEIDVIVRGEEEQTLKLARQNSLSLRRLSHMSSKVHAVVSKGGLIGFPHLAKNFESSLFSRLQYTQRTIKDHLCWPTSLKTFISRLRKVPILLFSPSRKGSFVP
jgi:hypothetical protein